MTSVKGKEGRVGKIDITWCSCLHKWQLPSQQPLAIIINNKTFILSIYAKFMSETSLNYLSKLPIIFPPYWNTRNYPSSIFFEFRTSFHYSETQTTLHSFNKFHNFLTFSLSKTWNKRIVHDLTLLFTFDTIQSTILETSLKEEKCSSTFNMTLRLWNFAL